jgi:hypothetical protein
METQRRGMDSRRCAPAAEAKWYGVSRIISLAIAPLVGGDVR